MTKRHTISIMLKTAQPQEVNTQPPPLFLTKVVEEENDAVLGKDENQSAAEKNGVKKNDIQRNV